MADKQHETHIVRKRSMISFANFSSLVLIGPILDCTGPILAVWSSAVTKQDGHVFSSKYNIYTVSIFSLS